MRSSNLGVCGITKFKTSALQYNVDDLKASSHALKATELIMSISWGLKTPNVLTLYVQWI